MGSIRRSWNWALSRFFCLLADVHRHFGNLYGNQEEHWSAIENYGRAIALDEDYAQAYYSRGVLYWREIGNYYRAVQDLSRVLDLDSGWAEAHFNRGMAYKLRQEPQKAVADFERYLTEGREDFWLEAARRQLRELREDGVEATDRQKGS